MALRKMRMATRATRSDRLLVMVCGRCKAFLSASNKTLFVCNQGELLLILRYGRIVRWRLNFCRTGYGN